MSINLFAGSPDTAWTRTFGGEDFEHGYGVRETQDGGYVIAGVTETFGAGASDVWLIKVDSSGAEEWSQTFGGSGTDWCYSVEQTQDGGYVVVGATQSVGAGGYDVWLIKTDTLGIEEWSRTFGGAQWDAGYSVEQTQDGGYVLSGYTGSFGAGLYDVWLIKTDTLGIEEWSQTFGGELYEVGYCLDRTTDGGYIISGATQSFGSGGYDVWLIKTDSSGAEDWSRTFGGTEDDQGFSVRQTEDGGYIVGGTVASFGAGWDDFWLIKTDTLGIEEWSQTFGGEYGDIGYAVQKAMDGGYVMTGITQSFGAGYGDFWLVKADSSGVEEWTETFGGADVDQPWSVIQGSDGGYVMIGMTRSYGAGDADLWLVKTESDYLVEESASRYFENLPLLSACPNPSSGGFRISYGIPAGSEIQLLVYDPAGRRVATLVDGYRVRGLHFLRWTPKDMRPGVYLLRLTAPGRTESARLILSR
jgi:hypothetical protein